MTLKQANMFFRFKATPLLIFFRSLSVIPLILFAITLASCSTMNVLPPEVNLMRVDVRDVTLSHVNLLADLRIFNPNDKAVIVNGVDYTLHLEGIKVVSGRSNQATVVEPQDYGYLSLRISSAYWDIIQLLNRLPDKTDVAFAMRGSVRIGGGNIFSKRFSFEKEGVIPLQNTPANLPPIP